MQYSVIIPAYNESESLKLLWQELIVAMKKLDAPWEAIIVDDGSTDTSPDILKNLTNTHAEMYVIRFSKNRGKAAALQAGFDAAKGKTIITLDADLQDDPAEIGRLIEKLNAGYDLVTGYKINRQDPIHKTVPSYFFNKLIRILSGVPVRDINSGLKAYRQPVIKQVRIYGDLHRFIPILAHADGFRVTEIDVNHRPRQFGKSKYGMGRFTRGLLDIVTVTFLTRFLKRPLHLFGGVGLVFLGIGLVSSIYLSVLHFAYGQSIGNRPLLLLGILLILAGIQLISTGLIAELVTYYLQRPSNQPNSLKQRE